MVLQRVVSAFLFKDRVLARRLDRVFDVVVEVQRALEILEDTQTRQELGLGHAKQLFKAERRQESRTFVPFWDIELAKPIKQRQIHRISKSRSHRQVLAKPLVRPSCGTARVPGGRPCHRPRGG